MNGSVKVMKSYDYCHFEVQLSDENISVEDVDTLGVEAQRLCDIQIERYKIKKAHMDGCNPFRTYEARKILSAIEEIPVAERTPEMAAVIKARDDVLHWLDRNFDYDDCCDYLPDPDLSDVAQQLKLQFDVF